ncbi:MAG: hypothetical protein P8Z78_14655 [Gammaproteobacteria bacterium]
MKVISILAASLLAISASPAYSEVSQEVLESIETPNDVETSIRGEKGKGVDTLNTLEVKHG